MASSCGTGDAVYGGWVGQIRGFFEQGINGILNDIASAIMSAAVDLFSDLGNIPTLAGSSNTSNGNYPTARGINDEIHGQVNWLVVALAVGSLLTAAFRMALERKGAPGIEALKGLVRMILVAGAAWYVISALATIADKYSDNLYDQGIKAQLKLIAQCGTDSLTAFLLIIVGLLLLVAGCVHVMMMYIRLGVLTLLLGTLPVAAAASMTETGIGWWRKHLAWIIAWLLYKPTVGLIMFGGAAMLGASGADEKQFKLAGAGILLLAGVALPALMRLVVPAMASFGSPSTAGLVGAAAGASGAAASGAKKVAGLAPAKSAAGGGGATGARGATGGGGGGGGGTKRALGSLARGVGTAATTATKVADKAVRTGASVHKHAAGVVHNSLEDG